ncbi:Hypothetical predicted protein [Xyrichtys novacula]|uniref:Uncharacterized protein n=1 Tax=Xyrichtys novacula TaxID=13765 RepID=A0AAV1HGY0_XYRNO|nr:Hypothetical predicted protein [Xyrichtys novacula]
MSGPGGEVNEPRWLAWPAIPRRGNLAINSNKNLASMVMDRVTCPPSVCVLSAVHTEAIAHLLLDCDRSQIAKKLHERCQFGEMCCNCRPQVITVPSFTSLNCHTETLLGVGPRLLMWILFPNGNDKRRRSAP